MTICYDAQPVCKSKFALAIRSSLKGRLSAVALPDAATKKLLCRVYPRRTGSAATVKRVAAAILVSLPAAWDGILGSVSVMCLGA